MSRVTGGGQSEILGRLGVLGGANFFLLNPNGIVFGPNSSLDIRGSFISSTADSLLFQNGVQFSATNPTAPPLLTLNVPIGLQFGANPGDIRVEGQGHNLRLDPETFATIRDDRPPGLQVDAGQTLALVAGEITLEGGNLTAEEGRLELGSVAGGGLATLTPINPGWMLDYAAVEQFQDIRLIQAASADSSGNGGGDIQVQGRNVLLSEGSAILADTLGAQPGGTLIVAASQSVELGGVTANGEYSSSLTANVAPTATGAGGNLTIMTNRLLLVDGGGVLTSTFGAGNAGDLAVQAQSVEIVGVNPVNGAPRGLTTSAQLGSTGEGGDLTLESDRLRLTGGGRVSTSTLSQGNAGDLEVIAQSVEVVGINPVKTQLASALTTSTGPSSTGNGGDLTLTTDRLRLVDGGGVSTSISGTGDAGDLKVIAHSVEAIGVNPVDVRFPSGLTTSVLPGSAGDGGDLILEADRLHLVDGGRVSTSTFGAGNAGDLTVQAQSLVEVVGVDLVNGATPSSLLARVRENAVGDAGSLKIATNRLQLANGGVVGAETLGNGAGGFISITAESISLSNRSGITSSSQSDGRAAGDIKITADESIVLDNQAFISSDTQGGRGDIDLATGLLLLRDNSIITTNADGAATGGNIYIEADLIVAVPDENSDIFANAFQGSGGQITLTTQAVFGFALRTRTELQQLLGNDPNDLTPRNLPSNDVTAFSQASSNIDVGTVIFQSPDVDPSRGLVELPIVPLAAADQIVPTCSTGGSRNTNRLQSEFIITGRGGLPANPLTLLNGDDILAGWATLDNEQNDAAVLPSRRFVNAYPEQPTATPSDTAIVEATGWERDAAGKVVLIAAVPIATSQLPLSNPAYCQ